MDIKKKDGKENFPEYQEKLPVKMLVGKWFLQEGFYLADRYGFALNSLEALDKFSIGILKDNPEIKSESAFSKKLFWLFPSLRPKNRKLFVGTIWVNVFEKKWNFSIYGRKNLEELTTLAKKLGKNFDVEVLPHLQQENQKLEKIL